MTCVVFLILLLVHCVHSLFLGTVWGPARDQYFVRDLTLWGYLAICITFGAALPLRFGDSMVRNISSLSIDYGVRSVKCSPGEQNVWINLGGVFLGCVFKFCAGILHLLFMLCFLDFAFKFVAA